MVGVAVKVTGAPAQTPVDPPVELMEREAVTTGFTTNAILAALPVAELLGLGQGWLVDTNTCTLFNCVTDVAVVVKVEEVAPPTVVPFIDH